MSGDDGPADEAAVGNPFGLALAPDGTLYVSQRVDKVVRAIAPDGTITTLAGGGTPEDGVGDGDSALDAEFASPHGLALDSNGTLYVADLAEFTEDLLYASRVRAIATDGSIRTVAGGGELRLALYANDSLRILAGEQKPEEGIAATEADLVTPSSIAIDTEGSLYIAETEAFRIRKVGADGRITRFAGTGSEEFTGEGGRALDAGLRPWGLAPSDDGSLYVSDNTNHRIRRIRPDGMIETVAGNGGVPTQEEALAGGPALAMSLIHPTALHTDGEGRLLFLQRSTLLTRLEDALPSFEHGDSLLADGSGASVFRFDKLGRHLATLDALSGVPLLEFEYDDAGLLVEARDRNGNATTIERDGRGRATAIVGPYGQRTDLAIDERGYLAELTNAADESFTFDYDAGGLLTAMTEPRSADELHLFEYDDSGRLVRDESPTGFYQTLSRRVTESSIEVTRIEREQRAYHYEIERLSDDTLRRRKTDAAGLATTIEVGAASVVQTPTQRITHTMGADPRFGMQSQYPALTTVEIEAGPSTTVERSREVRLSEEHNPLSLEEFYEATTTNGREALTSYQAENRTLTTESPSGRVLTVEQDILGRPVRMQQGTQAPAEVQYDDRGRITQVTAGERTTRYEYGRDGRLAALVDPVGQRQELEYDIVGRPTRLVLTGGDEIRSSYDANGLLSSLQPPGRTKHLFAYTPGDLLKSYSPPALMGGGTADTATQYSYDPFDALAEIAPPGDDSVVMNYQDTTGRLLTQTFPGDTVRYAYDDSTGQVTRITSHDAVLEHTFLGPLIESVRWSGDVQGSVSFTYDDNRWLATRRVGDETVAYTHDDDGLVTQAGAETITRDADNGWVTGTSLGDISESFVHSNHGELSEHTAGQGGTSLYARAETRDALGRVVSRQESVLGETHDYEYTYDARGRLENATADGVTRSYVYDENGNRLGVAGHEADLEASYDAQDRLLRYGDTEYAYTAQGSLSTKTDSAGVTRYDYDLLGNLRTVELPDGRSLEYLIDGLGRRIGKRVDGTFVLGWLYQDNLNPVAELDAEGNVLSTFVYAARDHVPDYIVRGNATYKLVTDAIGSVRLVVDAATGEIAQHIDYDEFGNVLLDTNPGFQPFGFAGGLYDPLTGLVRFGARDYDAETGRWTAKDPILFGGRQTNLYQYAYGDPINYVDPNGMVAPMVIGGIVGGAIGAGAGALGALASGGDPLSGAIVGGLTGAAIGSGAALLAGIGAEAAGLGLGGEALLGAYGGAHGGFFGNVLGQVITTGEIDPRQAGRAAALGATAGICGGAALGSLTNAGYSGGWQTVAGVETAVGMSIAPIDVGWSALTAGPQSAP